MVRQLVIMMGVLCATSGVTAVARADRVILAGGSTIEGKATRKGGMVKIEVESGEISLPADSVERIEKSDSEVSRFEARYAALPSKDVGARLVLADYCRDHDMRSREHQLLLEVVALDTNNATARSRLGFVKTETGWVTQAELMHAKGLVQHDGRWVNEGQLRATERADEAQAAARDREDTEAELAARNARAAAQQADFEASQSQLQGGWGSSYYSPYYAPFYRTGFGGFTRRSSPGFFHGDRSSTSLSVVKVPYRRH